jgi:hypothetical protein
MLPTTAHVRAAWPGAHATCLSPLPGSPPARLLSRPCSSVSLKLAAAKSAVLVLTCATDGHPHCISVPRSVVLILHAHLLSAGCHYTCRMFCTIRGAVVLSTSDDVVQSAWSSLERGFDESCPVHLTTGCHCARQGALHRAAIWSSPTMVPCCSYIILLGQHRAHTCPLTGNGMAVPYNLHHIGVLTVAPQPQLCQVGDCRRSRQHVSIYVVRLQPLPPSSLEGPWHLLLHCDDMHGICIGVPVL